MGDIISIIEAFLNFFLVYKLENLEKPYLLIRFLWFICKVSSFFRTFTKQSIADSNNITLTAVREERKTKPRGNKHKCVCTLVRVHVRMTSKWCTKSNAIILTKELLWLFLYINKPPYITIITYDLSVLGQYIDLLVQFQSARRSGPKRNWTIHLCRSLNHVKCQSLAAQQFH